MDRERFGFPADFPHGDTSKGGGTTNRHKLENVGFQVPILRHRYLEWQSLSHRRGLQKPNNGGHFVSDLLTGLGGGGVESLSVRPILSKAEDCGI
jgi:hypothetical protein